MSTQQAKSSKMSSSIDTSHLKVKFPFKSKYGNFIGGKFVEPKSGKYFDNTTPITNEVICQVPRSNEKDVEAALDAAHAAFPSWGKTSITERSNILLKIADVIEKNLNLLATAECLDNGKPIRECMAADLPLVVDHWRYFAGVIRAEEGSVAEISNSEYSYHIPEPLGVVGNYTVELSVVNGYLETSTGFSSWKLCSFKTSRTNTSINITFNGTDRRSIASRSS